MQIKNLDARMTFTGECELIVTLPNSEKQAVENVLQEFPTKEQWEVEIKPKRKKRTLDASAKAWVLLGEIAKELSKNNPISAEEIYRNMIPDVSKGEVIPIRNEAVETWIYNWEHKPNTKIGWISKSLGESKIKGYTNTINWFGSSCFDSVEMSKLLELIIQECQQLKIDTLSPLDKERLLKLWG